MRESPTPVEVTLATLVRAAKQSGFTLPMIRAWLTEKLERERQPGWPEAWRLVFDDDGHFSLVTPDGKIDVNEAVLKLSPKQTALVEKPATPLSKKEETEITPLTKAQENEIAINLTVGELKKNPGLTQKGLWRLIKGAGPWTKTFAWNRFREKVLKTAYERAEVQPLHRGRPTED